MGVRRFISLRRCVATLARSIEFYCGGLGFTVETQKADSAHLRLGDEVIELVTADSRALREATHATPSDVHFQHVAIVTTDMPVALRRLAAFSPELISQAGAVQLPAASGGVTACKFRDPDGHALELIAFPAGTGDPRWHQGPLENKSGPTAGIDHAALSISNMARSLAFYVDGLGFTVTSRQLNHGPEQDSLDGVSPAVVEVVGLTAEGTAGPRLELLGYRSPPPQPRPRLPPLTEDCGDRLVWAVDDLGATVVRLCTVHPESLRGHIRLGETAVLLRDDDGHRLVLVQSQPEGG